MNTLDDVAAPALSDLELREVASFAPVLIWRAGPDGLRTWFNDQWLSFVGHTIEQEVGDGWVEAVHEEDRLSVLDVGGWVGPERSSNEYRLRRHDGVFRWMLENRAPIYRQGVPVGYFGSCVDVSHMKHSLAGQQRLISELDHRVKNTIVNVQSIAAQSFRRVSDDNSRKLFESRLMTLAKAHDVLARRNWESADLFELVRDVVGPHQSADRQRFWIEGEHLNLEPRLVLALAFALNELCLNAAQHGAFSMKGGRVDLSWRMSAEPAQLQLRWVESGGPEMLAPGDRGFGLRLLKQLERELEGTVTVLFHSSGIECVMEATLGFRSAALAPPD